MGATLMGSIVFTAFIYIQRSDRLDATSAVLSLTKVLLIQVASPPLIFISSVFLS